MARLPFGHGRTQGGKGTLVACLQTWSLCWDLWLRCPRSLALQCPRSRRSNMELNCQKDRYRIASSMDLGQFILWLNQGRGPARPFKNLKIILKTASGLGNFRGLLCPPPPLRPLGAAMLGRCCQGVFYPPPPSRPSWGISRGGFLQSRQKRYHRTLPSPLAVQRRQVRAEQFHLALVGYQRLVTKWAQQSPPTAATISARVHLATQVTVNPRCAVSSVLEL
jgi:hypothetical protein